MASRMESTGAKNKVQNSEDTYKLIKGHFIIEKREGIKIKGIGLKNTYLIISEKR